MSQGQDFSEADYQSYWSLTPEGRSQKLQDEQVPAAHKAILLFQQGLVCAEEKEYDRAIASYDKALEIKPDYYECWQSRGYALQNLNRYEEAIASYDKALEFKPDYYYSWHNRGNALRSLERYEEAFASYDKALEIQPDNYEALWYRGNALENLNRYDDAIASYDKALEIQPDYYIAWRSRGNALHNLNRYDDAIASYDKALEIQPDDYTAWFLRGYSLGNLNRYEEAIASYDKALEIQPDSYTAWWMRGYSLGNLNRYYDEIASYDKALEIQPDYYIAWRSRGNALHNLNRYEEAIISYDKALEICPKDSVSKQSKFLSLLQYGKFIGYLTNRWAKRKNQNLYTIIFLIVDFILITPIKYLLLFGATIAVMVLASGTLWGEIIKSLLSILFSLLILGLAIYEIWNKKAKLGKVYNVYFKSGIIAYLRAGIIIFITIITIMYTPVPEFMKWGWSQLIFSNSGNVVTQPLDTAYQASQKLKQIEEKNKLAIQPSDKTSPDKPYEERQKFSSKQKSNFDYKWLFLVPIWILFILAVPFWAEFEENAFRRGVHSWRGMTINSIKFGLVHLWAGIPIYVALTLSIPGFLFACRYKYAYHRHLKKFKDENKAQDAGVAASTADHAIYNALLITFLVAGMLLAK